MSERELNFDIAGYMFIQYRMKEYSWMMGPHDPLYTSINGKYQKLCYLFIFSNIQSKSLSMGTLVSYAF